MKILEVASYISDENIEVFSKVLTGYGYIIKDITNNLGKENDVFLITRKWTKKCKVDNFTLLEHSIIQVLKNLKIESLKFAIKSFFCCENKLYSRIKNFYFMLLQGYFEKIIKTLKIEVVHIHEIGYNTIPIILACLNTKTPYIVTLHGLLGLSEEVICDNYIKIFEKDFFKLCEKYNQTITVVSSGCKEDAINNYKLLKANNIKVINNPIGRFSDNKSFNKKDIRELYNIPKERKIFLCIGNICSRKNQTQIVDACQYLDEKIKDEICILILGEDRENGKLDEMIKKNKATSFIKYVGYIDHSILEDFYKIADYNMLVSIDEGFGLSFIEGYYYGIPSITFSDLQAVKDVYHKDCMFLINSRQNKDLAKGIEDMLKIDWNKDKIKKFSQKFSNKEITKKYMEELKKSKSILISKKEMQELIHF